MNRTRVMFSAVLVLALAIGLPAGIQPVKCSTQDSGIHGELIMSSPSGFAVFSGTMPLDITVCWSVTAPIPWMNVNLSYSIDGAPAIHFANGSLVIFQSSSDLISTSGATVVDISSLTSGRHTVTISADGNYNIDDDFIDPLSYTFSPVPFYVNLLPAPSISILSPQNKTYHIADATLNFTVDMPASWIGYSLDGQKSERLSGNKTLPGLPDGSHSIIVYANNTAGDIGSSRVTFTVATPPKITLLSPTNRTYNQNTFSLTFKLDQPVSWMGYSLDGKPNATTAGNATLTMISVGSHNITLYANDAFGNSVASQTVSFAVAKPVSLNAEATTFTVSGIAVAAAVCLGFVFYYKWRKRRSV